MSGARKLQTEIDRVMKKVDEGVILFDDIWEKVYAAEQQNQKEKHEMDLKKEIKKLQRLRDQIKSWIGSSDVKDKDPLIDARKLIETKMEQFKICEKETKTKTYSKEGLMRQEKLDPREEEKQKTISWIQEIIDQMQNLVDECDLEIERLSSGKGKKTNRHKIEDQTHTMDNHKFHITKLEGIMRLVNNDRLEAENVNELKEDLEYYLEAHDDDDYMMGYDEEMFYEILGLEDMDVVTVDRVTSIESGNRKKSKDDDSSAHSGSEKGSKSSKEGKKKKSSSSSSMIPLTIGRATVRSASSSSKSGKDDHEKDSKSIASNNSNTSTPTKTSIGIPTPTSSHKTAAAPGTSMASILKRESELQQEKERQAKAAQAAALQQQQQQQQQLLREQQAREQQARAQQQEQIRQQQAHQQRQDALRQQQEALKRQQQQLQDQQMRQAKENANKQQLQLQQQRQNGTTGTLESLLTSGLGSLSLGASELSGNNMNVPSPIHSVTAVSQPLQQSRSSYDTSSYLGLLNDSFLHCPSTADSERQRSYVPNNPYPVPTSFPTVPQDVFENPAVFEKMGTDCLFFIFYYSQGTYQQYLAARQLKKQNWRYHKKYMTWFQRHEEPKITTDEFEQGTYVYFDYETGWCKRLKSDFKFEYSFLEDHNL